MAGQFVTVTKRWSLSWLWDRDRKVSFSPTDVPTASALINNINALPTWGTGTLTTSAVGADAKKVNVIITFSSKRPILPGDYEYKKSVAAGPVGGITRNDLLTYLTFAATVVTAIATGLTTTYPSTSRTLGIIATVLTAFAAALKGDSSTPAASGSALGGAASTVDPVTSAMSEMVGGAAPVLHAAVAASVADGATAADVVNAATAAAQNIPHLQLALSSGQEAFANGGKLMSQQAVAAGSVDGATPAGVAQAVMTSFQSLVPPPQPYIAPPKPKWGLL